MKGTNIKARKTKVNVVKICEAAATFSLLREKKYNGYTLPSIFEMEINIV